MATRAGRVCPSGIGLPWTSNGTARSSTSRRSFPGSHASMRWRQSKKSPQPQNIVPPVPGSTFAWNGNQRTSSPASVSAFQTVAGSAAMSMVGVEGAPAPSEILTCGRSLMAFLQNRMNGGEEAEAPALRRPLVVICGGERRDGARQLFGEPGTRRGGREPDVSFQRER